MVVIPMTNKKNVQVFACGKLQILGQHSHLERQWMICKAIRQLRRIFVKIQPTTLTLRNMVVSAQLNKIIKLHHIETSSPALFYETELFPAALIRKWHPIHIAVFHNGRCILTGLKSLTQAHAIIDDLITFLNNKHLI